MGLSSEHYEIMHLVMVKNRHERYCKGFVFINQAFFMGKASGVVFSKQNGHTPSVKG